MPKTNRDRRKISHKNKKEHLQGSPSILLWKITTMTLKQCKAVCKQIYEIISIRPSKHNNFETVTNGRYCSACEMFTSSNDSRCKCCRNTFRKGSRKTHSQYKKNRNYVYYWIELRQTGNFWDYKNYNYCMEMCRGDRMYFRFAKTFKKCPNCGTKARTKPRVGKCRRKFGNLYNKRI